MPVGCALDVGGLDLATASPPARAGVRPRDAVAKRCLAAPSATASTSVFQAPQLGHLPSHFGLVPPHSVQV